MVRFFFGSGWWIAWHVAMYAAIVLLVGLTLAIFATDLRPAGAKPDTPSPASFMVFFIALTMALITLVNSILLVCLVGWPWYADALFVLAATAATLVIGGILNNHLALDQGRPAFWMNVGFVLTSTLCNLAMMSRFK